MENNPSIDPSQQETVAPESAPETAPAQPQPEAATPPAESAQPAAEGAPAPAPAPAKRKPPLFVKKTGLAALGAERTKLLDLLYGSYDLKWAEADGGAFSIELWHVPADQKGKPADPQAKEKWPARGDLSRPRDYRLLIYFSKVVDPSFAVSGKDLTAVIKDNKSGLVLLMKDEKGYFITSDRLSEFSQLFPLAADGAFKITGPKLRKGGVARFFSLNGFSGELAAALRG